MMVYKVCFVKMIIIKQMETENFVWFPFCYGQSCTLNQPLFRLK